MKARCLVSFFSQNVSGTKDAIIEVSDQKTFDELVQAGYIEAVTSSSDNPNIANSPQELEAKQTKRKATVQNESQ